MKSKILRELRANRRLSTVKTICLSILSNVAKTVFGWTTFNTTALNYKISHMRLVVHPGFTVLTNKQHQQHFQTLFRTCRNIKQMKDGF